MHKITMGQVVFVKNRARGGTDFIETVVTKVGKKYFEVDGFHKNRFFVDTLKHDGSNVGYGSRYTVYLSKQEIQDEDEYNALEKELRKAFAWDGKVFTLDQMRKIKTIIG